MRTPRLLILLAALAAPIPAFAAPVATPIAFLGDAAPGLPGGSFTSLSASVNDSGQVAITGSASGVMGIWQWDLASGGMPAPVLLPGAPLGPAGAEIARAFVREITPSGRIGLEGTLATGPGGVTTANDTFLGSFAPGEGHTIVAREGDPAPGIPGHTLVLLPVDSIADWNSDGDVVQSIGAFAPPFSLSGALYRYDAESGLTPLVMAGDPVPGDPSRMILGGGVIHAINEAGDIGFASSTRTSLSEPADATLFGPDGAGGFRELIRVDGQAPGLPDGATVRFIPGGGFFSMNEAGEMAFTADLFVGGGGLTGDDNSGLWVASPGGDIILRHREGDPIATAPGLFFGAFAGTPLLNSAGDLAHAGQLAVGAGGVTVSDNSVLLVPDGAGGLAIGARENDANPLLPDERWGVFSVLAFGEGGGLIFRGSDNETGRARLYYRDPGGTLSLLAGIDLDIDLGGGDVRTIASLAEFGASRGAEQLVVEARFTDGTTALVLVTVPEPGTALLIAAGLATLAGVGSRRSR